MDTEKGIEIKVLASELKGLTDKVDQGFHDMKELFNASRGDLRSLEDEVGDRFKESEKEIQTLKIEMTKFKERWLLIGGVISLGGSVLVDLLVHAIK
jgi:hypothetical protein